MPSVHRTLIVPASVVESARALADQFGPRAQNMWLTGLSPTGAEPATHYISAGLIDADFAPVLSSPENLVAGAALEGMTVSLEDATALLSVCDVSEEEPYAAMSRLGLQLVHIEEPI